MKNLIYTFLFCSLFANAQRIDQAKLNDAKHFYASFAICDLSYHAQKNLFPNQKEHNRFLISAGIAVTAGTGKELFDKYRPNVNKRTGFDKMDLFTDLWGVLCWVPFRICINDFKNNKRNSIYE